MMPLLIEPSNLFKGSICQRVTPRSVPATLKSMSPEVILVAQDVGQHREAVAFLDQAHRDSRDVRLDRNAGIHQREAASANRGHR